MDLHRFCVKVLAEDSKSLDILTTVPVFHRWIRQKQMPDHLLIDVADYSHVWQGPGIMLVAHEANFSLDQTGGNLGLLYQRKQPIKDTHPLRAVLVSTLQACRHLEEEPELKGKIKFRGDRILVMANDRLRTPATQEALSALEQELTGLLSTLYKTEKPTLTPGTDPKERATITITGKSAVDVKTLLERLEANP